jgi:hypothetical protein
MREKHLILDNDYFFAKEQRYPVNAIDSLYFYYVQTQKTVNFTAAGIDHDVTVRIYLAETSAPLEFNSLGHLRLGNAGKKASESLIAKFDYLCSRTYLRRQSRQLVHLRDDGFFLYDGKRICSNGDVISDRWQFNLRSDRPILRSPFIIFYERKREGGIFRKTERCEIRTRFDSDVFFSILSEMFGLKWS